MNKTGLSVLVIAILFAVVLSCFTICTADPGKVRFSVGYSLRSMQEIDVKDAAAALRIWAQEIGNKFGFHVETALYESIDVLTGDLVAGKIDFAVFQSIDYVRVAQRLKVKPDTVTVKNDRVGVKYLFVASADDQRKRIGDFRKKRLSILRSNSLGMLFLNTELLKANLPEAERFFDVIQEKSRESQALLSVFFGQADACVVTDTGFNVAKELNPQIEKRLRVIADSPVLVEVVGVFRKDYKEEYKERAIHGMQSIQGTPRGKQIMLLFRTDKMNAFKDGQLDTVNSLLTENRRLRGR